MCPKQFSFLKSMLPMKKKFGKLLFKPNAKIIRDSFRRQQYSSEIEINV